MAFDLNDDDFKDVKIVADEYLNFEGSIKKDPIYEIRLKLRRYTDTNIREVNIDVLWQKDDIAADKYRDYGVLTKAGRTLTDFDDIDAVDGAKLSYNRYKELYDAIVTKHLELEIDEKYELREKFWSNLPHLPPSANETGGATSSSAVSTAASSSAKRKVSLTLQAFATHSIHFCHFRCVHKSAIRLIKRSKIKIYTAKRHLWRNN